MRIYFLKKVAKSLAILKKNLQLQKHVRSRWRQIIMKKQLIYQHFGHSGDVNLNVYQSAVGSQQIATTGKMLLEVLYLEIITNSDFKHLMS